LLAKLVSEAIAIERNNPLRVLAFGVETTTEKVRDFIGRLVELS